MSNNFINLFNQVTNLVNTYSRAIGNRNGNINQFLHTQINSASNRVLPQIDLNNTQNLSQIKQNELINTQLQESILQTQEALKEFTQSDKASLIKNMLNLPEELKDLLKLLSNKKERLTNTEFMKLLSSLNINGKEASAKLSKLLVILGSNNLKGAEKIQDISNIIAAFSAGTAQNASQLMKNIILLYLPWLPIGESNNFDIGLRETETNKGDSNEENSESDNVVIFIQTVNYSNIKVTLYKEQRQDVKMFIECVASFPKEELTSKIKGDAQKLNVHAQIDFAENKNKNQTKNDEQDFNVNVSKFINPYLILMAQAVIKAVIEIDKHTSLIEARKAN